MNQVKELTKHEKIVLQSLAYLGPGNILGVSDRENIQYPTARRSIRSLQGRGLVWCSQVGDRGPKSPQTFSLTPLGLLASFLFCELWGSVGDILEVNRENAPQFIRYFDKFVEYGLKSNLLDVSLQVYYDAALLVVDSSFVKGKVQFVNVDVKRNSLDLHFLSIFDRKYSLVELEKMGPIINFDVGYRRVWFRWISIQRFKNSYRETLNQEIDPVNGKSFSSYDEE
jgi:hypothetical protein